MAAMIQKRPRVHKLMFQWVLIVAVAVMAAGFSAGMAVAIQHLAPSPTQRFLMAAAVGVFFTSEPGKQLIGYGRDSVREVKKVVWPTRKEAGQMTLYVFGFVVVMALYLWLTDKTLEWVIFSLILGWR
jgi:preprotein translocase SecE subunit